MAIKSTPKVFLLLETSHGYSRGIFQGIGRYVREHGPWSIFFEERGLEEEPPHWLKSWNGDGIISRTATAAIDRQLAKTRLPRVELLGLKEKTPAKVHGDNWIASRMAAEHLMGCGLQHFGFFVCGEAWWIANYREAFCRTLAENGFSCDVYRPPIETNRILPRWQENQRRSLIHWLESLPQPSGIFAPTDARIVLDYCRRLGIAVPERMAILGGDEDPMINCVSTPPLSCIDFGSERIGYKAAAMLDRMMAGEKPPETVQWIPPARVVVRQSTDIVAIEDQDVAQAVRFIREHACNGINVQDVAEAVSISRRGLERRFSKYLGRTLKSEILRVQMDHVKMLLSDTMQPIETIARKSGFRAIRHFAEIFRRKTGFTPHAYRKAQLHLE